MPGINSDYLLSIARSECCVNALLGTASRLLSLRVIVRAAVMCALSLADDCRSRHFEEDERQHLTVHGITCTHC